MDRLRGAMPITGSFEATLTEPHNLGDHIPTAEYELHTNRWRRAYRFSAHATSAEKGEGDGFTVNFELDSAITSEPWPTYLRRVLTKEPIYLPWDPEAE